MKKRLFYLFALICSVSLFTACSDDDNEGPSGNPITEAIDSQIVGNYNGKLTVLMGQPMDFHQKVAVTKAGETSIDLLIKDFSFPGMGSLGDINLKNCELTQNGDKYVCTREEDITLKDPIGTCPTKTSISFADGKLDVALHITWQGVNIDVTYGGKRLTGSESSEAKITSFKFDSSVEANQVVTDVILNEEAKTIAITVLGSATPEQLSALVPTIEVSAGAVLDPKSGVATDFTGEVKYTVIAENGESVVYTASVAGNKYDFENWVAGVEGQEPDMTFYEPTGWSSSNTGAHFLKSFGLASEYVVMETEDAHTGNKAALVKSIDTKGQDLFLAKAPKVTTGTLFLGAFKTDIASTLNSTKFGIPYTNKPVMLKGWYKYTPGETYYIVTKEPYDQNCHNAWKEDNSKTDEFAISIVLYETEEYDTENWSDCLTGVADAENNIYKSSRIAAIGQITGGAQADWKSFELPLEWKKEYSADKKYRMTIACSSSKDGDKFWGAPGSTLIVDDFELIYE